MNININRCFLFAYEIDSFSNIKTWFIIDFLSLLLKT